MRGNSQWVEEERRCEDCTVPRGSGAGHGFAGGSHAGAVCPPAPSPSPAAAQACRALPGTSSFLAWNFCNRVHDGGDSPSMGDLGDWGDLLWEAPPRAC